MHIEVALNASRSRYSRRIGYGFLSCGRIPQSKSLHPHGVYSCQPALKGTAPMSTNNEAPVTLPAAASKVPVSGEDTGVEARARWEKAKRTKAGRRRLAGELDTFARLSLELNQNRPNSSARYAEVQPDLTPKVREDLLHHIASEVNI